MPCPKSGSSESPKIPVASHMKMTEYVVAIESDSVRMTFAIANEAASL
jgi:hypothetical protein